MDERFVNLLPSVDMMKKFFITVPRYTAILMICIAAFALWQPQYFMWVKGTSQSILLGVIMLTMGMTLTVNDFRGLVTSPLKMSVGIVSQYLVMSCSALLLMKLFHLDQGLFIGLALVAACPGAVSSNMMSLLARADVAYSVGMTAVNTLISPFVTPLLVLWLSGSKIEVNTAGLFQTIILVVGLPTIIGIVVNCFLQNRPKFEECKSYFPFLSVVGLGCVIGGVSANEGKYFLISDGAVEIFSTLRNVVIFSTLLNVMGFLGGWGIAKMFRFSLKSKKTLSLEVGMQNAGLATVLATTHFADLQGAAVMAAFSCVWYTITGAILANIYAKYPTKEIETVERQS